MCLPAGQLHLLRARDSHGPKDIYIPSGGTATRIEWAPTPGLNIGNLTAERFSGNREMRGGR